MADTDEPPAKRVKADVKHFEVPADAYAGPADIILRTSDGLEYRCHKAYLKTSCRTFNSMLQTTDSSAALLVEELPIVQLAERAEILDYLLPYCYNVRSRQLDTETFIC